MYILYTCCGVSQLKDFMCTCAVTINILNYLFENKCSPHRSAGSAQWAPFLLACIPWSSCTPPSLYDWCSLCCSCQTPRRPHGALTNKQTNKNAGRTCWYLNTASDINILEKVNLTFDLLWSQLSVLLEEGIMRWKRTHKHENQQSMTLYGSVAGDDMRFCYLKCPF